jgi:hypothetical protein
MYTASSATYLILKEVFRFAGKLGPLPCGPAIASAATLPIGGILAALAVSVPEGGAAAGTVLALGADGGGAIGIALGVSPLVADDGVLADATTWFVFAVTAGLGTLVTGVEFREGVAGGTEAEFTPAP